MIQKKTFGLMMILACFGVLVWFLGYNNNTSNVELPTAVVTQGNLKVLVNASGRLEAAHSTSISPNLPGDKGKIVWIIDDGTLVKAGDVLVRFDDSHFQENVSLLAAKLVKQKSVIESNEQAAAWEENQALREVKSAEFDVQIALSDFNQLEQGDGPLELTKLEEALHGAKRIYKQSEGYLQDLNELVKSGMIEQLELEKAQIELEAAGIDLTVAKDKYKSFKEFIYPSRLHRARAKFERSKISLEELKKSAGFQIGQAKAKLEEARQTGAHLEEQWQNAKRILEDTVIMAPQEGLAVLIEKHISGELRKSRIGDVAWQGQPLMQLPDLREMVVESQVREIDLHRIAKGQQVAISIDAYPKLKLTGEIDSIGVLAQKQQESRRRGKVFNVRIKIFQHDQRLRPGMNARTEILCATKSNVLLAPIAAVFGNGDKQWVYVRNNQNWQRQEIETGLASEQRIEITRGINEGQILALVEPSAHK